MARRVVHVGKSETDNPYVPGLENEDILEARATVYNVVLMAVFEHAPDLSHEPPCYALS